MSPLIVMAVVFIGVSALVGGVLMYLRSSGNEEITDRLDVLTGHAQPKKAAMNEGVLTTPLDDRPNFFEHYVMRLFNLRLLLEQADAPLTLPRFLAVCAVMSVGGAIVTTVTRTPVYWTPVAAIGGGLLPLIWVSFRRKRRLRKFGAQMPDALELVSRALRSGHSLSSGLHLVSQEMGAPISVEFQRVFEEQNFGIPLEEALESMTERVPNLDLKFFATAVVLQRQTGGDLAEILDKIGYIIRERFKIWGQVQALTGEGRLSGVVLLGLPPALMLAVWKLNPEYLGHLFNDEMGKQMLIGATIMQVLGALVIRKIVNIKV